MDSDNNSLKRYKKVSLIVNVGLLIFKKHSGELGIILVLNNKIINYFLSIFSLITLVR